MGSLPCLVEEGEEPVLEDIQELPERVRVPFRRGLVVNEEGVLGGRTPM